MTADSPQATRHDFDDLFRYDFAADAFGVDCPVCDAHIPIDALPGGYVCDCGAELTLKLRAAWTPQQAADGDDGDGR